MGQFIKLAKIIFAWLLPGSCGWRSTLNLMSQGSMLRPVLFLLYINNINENIQSQIRLSADKCMHAVLNWLIHLQQYILQVDDLCISVNFIIMLHTFRCPFPSYF